MRALRIVTFVTAVAAGLAVTAVPASAATGVLYTRLTGAAVPTGGDPDGSGFGLFIVNTDTNQVCSLVVVSAIDPATDAHVHFGAAGQVGGHAVELIAPTSGFSYSCSTVSDQVADRLLAEPAGFYLNVHNIEYPSGAVRGQLGSLTPALPGIPAV